MPSPTRGYSLPILYLCIHIASLYNQVDAADRPNFLFILTDDQSPDAVGAYGNPVVQTPNIDRLAREGMLLSDAHHMGSWSGAVCLPSRTMIMTGQSVWRLPNYRGSKASVDRQSLQQASQAAAKRSMAALFNAAGYDTFRTCKRGNTFGPANEMFQVRHEADKRGDTDETGSAWHADRALEYLKRRVAVGDTDPFLMFLGFSHPHDPRNGRPDLLAKYGAANAKLPPEIVNATAPPLQINYLPEHPFPHGHPNLRDEVSVSGVLTSRTEATIRNELGKEYACIENIDQQIGRVLVQLEAMGQLENTYIFYTADHGIAVGRHGLTGKQNLYEHTWRVPMIVRGPSIKPGSSRSGYVYLMDVLPTLCDLAGIDIPQDVEGISFRPVLEGKQERVRDVMYGVYCGGTKPGMRSVKKDDWKLIKYDTLDGKVRETQLFDLTGNPHELLMEHHTAEVVAQTGNRPEEDQRNLAYDGEFAAKRRELEQLLLAQQELWGDPYRMWDQ
ncbi:MAG: sulfatase-like hydrolase/transferase [Planctomycetales bacterium]|nr:sulfatase-like hydrolase/transferase [Planctomycetales bacterium]